MSDVEDYALDEMLQLAVFVVDLPAEMGSWEGGRMGEGPALQDLPVLNGPQPLLRSSLLEIFRDGQAEVRAFRAAKPNTYLHVSSDVPEMIVRRDHLIITREERDRFEREHGATSTPEALPIAEFSHNEDFTKVHVAGEWHSFGPKQAAVLRILKLASEADDPWRDGKRLLGDVGSTTLRLTDLFKRRSVWRQLVQADGKGCYRFNATALSPERRRIRLFRKTGRVMPKMGAARMATMIDS
ncbi:MAG: hypothetical protein PS018_18135 [bacterium]|nr:hypothetical protein [bacterium]